MVQAQPDDLIGVEFSPADVATAELLGYDLQDPQLYDPLMGVYMRGKLRDILRRARTRIRSIAQRVRARIKARRGGAAPTAEEAYATVTTPRGTLTVGPGGVNIESAAREAEDTAVAPAPGGIMQTIQQNPLLLAIPAGLLVLMAMRKR